MGVSCNVCYELEDGTVRGVRSHYDGMPRNMFPILRQESWEGVRDAVEVGLMNGSFHAITPDRWITMISMDRHRGNSYPITSYVELARPVLDFPPQERTQREEYSYLKRRDGTVMCWHGWEKREVLS